MKIRFFRMLLITVLIGTVISGCQGRMGQAVNSAGKTAEHGVETARDQLNQSIGENAALEQSWPGNPVLTPQEANQIALKHAGLTEDLVLGLHVQYEIEHGTPIYDVEFCHRAWEYDYEIHADTGEILAFSKDG